MFDYVPEVWQIFWSRLKTKSDKKGESKVIFHQYNFCLQRFGSMILYVDTAVTARIQRVRADNTERTSECVA